MSRPTSRALGTLGALAVLAGVESLQSFGVSVFMPQVAATLEVTAISLISVRGAGVATAFFLPQLAPGIPAARRLAVQVWSTRVGALLAGLVLALTGEVRGQWGLVGVLILGALMAGPGLSLHRPMALAEVDERLRIRALSTIALGALLAQVALTAPVAAGAFATWHRTLIVVGFVAAAAVALAAVALRPDAAHAVPGPPADEIPDLAELGRAWAALRSMIGAGIALCATAMLLMPYDAVLAIYLHQRWHLGMQGTCGVFLALAGTGVVVVIGFAALGDARFAGRSPQLSRFAAVALAVASALLVAGPLVPGRAAEVALIAVGTALANALVPMLVGLGTSIVAPTQRASLASVAAAAVALGSLVGVVVAVCVADRYGVRYALVSLAGVGGIAAAVLGGTSAYVEADASRQHLQRLDVRPEGAARTGGALLRCDGVDFSYGSLQVLFGVDMHVGEGEIVGLLGTNGAGKSTLLRVISGLGIPQAGTVTFGSRDITYLDAEARVRLGITQVPGGQAVFRSMNVVENLRSYGYTLGRDRRAVDEGIERCFEAFPRLRERRTSAAAMLSGGEQQMVALSKALILRPRILLIDELSLGLAPVIVERLLDMVRRINAEGTAVVIVEQSVTTALSLVDRAYFMEKGEVRFDGPAADLIERHDLLRAVFLEGAARGVVS